MKNRDDILHNLLDNAGSESERSVSEGPDAVRLSRYREGLKRLSDHREPAPDGFVARVMEELPLKPRLAWTDRLKSFWPEKRFWAVPGLAGALAMLLIFAGITFFRSPSNTGLIPVVLDLRAPSAKQVELVGTFSDWTPGAFQLKGPGPAGYWAILIKLPPGRYEYAFLVNGSQLVPDDDGEALRPDGFGNENSLLLVKSGPSQLVEPYGFTPHEYATISQNDPNGPALSLPDQDRELWQAILHDGVASGIERSNIENLLSRLAGADITPDQARSVLSPLFQDDQMDNHAPYVFRRIQEGVLKKTRPETLKAMAESRHEAFKKARALLARTGHEAPLETDPILLNTTAFALEDGQSLPSLYEILSSAKDKPPTQVAAVIETGETLRHAGLEPEMLSSIMKDCLSKDLKPRQMKRVTEQIMEQLQKGTNPKTIYDALWV